MPKPADEATDPEPARLDPQRAVNVSVQVIPMVEDGHPVVDRAIEAIARHGVRYEVGPLQTVMEGPLDRLLEAARAAHLACMEAGAGRTITLIEIADDAGGTSLDARLAKYREAGVAAPAADADAG